MPDACAAWAISPGSVLDGAASQSGTEIALTRGGHLSRQLVICGMHRSGTSLVANVLKNAGLDIGGDISGPGLGNRRGHFEDQDFYRLHEAMLAAAGESCFTATDDFEPPAGGDFERRARMLVEGRKEIPLWGWKDPRTCLFLDFWDRLLPDARYLIVYRHPVDVALSLWRRNSDLEVRQDPWLAMRAWEVYNRRLVKFCERHPERCFLAQVPALTENLSELVRRLRVKLGLPLNDNGVVDVFAPDELMPHPTPNPAWGELIPHALALYQRLEERADLPARGASLLADRQPDRERELLRTSELLLFALLERNGQGSPTPPLDLRQAYYRLRVQEEAAYASEREIRIELEAELAQERLRAQELSAALEDSVKLAQVLAEIEGSRSFALVSGWWRLLRRLKERRN